jgi:hypothetical protein
MERFASQWPRVLEVGDHALSSLKHSRDSGDTLQQPERSLNRTMCEGSSGAGHGGIVSEFHFSPYRSPAGKSDRLMKQKRATWLDGNETVKPDSQQNVRIYLQCDVCPDIEPLLPWRGWLINLAAEYERKCSLLPTICERKCSLLPTDCERKCSLLPAD